MLVISSRSGWLLELLTELINERRRMKQLVATSDFSNMRFQMNVRILKIPPVFDDPKVFSKGNVVFDEPSMLWSQSYFK